MMTQKKISNEEAKQALMKLARFVKQETVVSVNKGKTRANELAGRVKAKLNDRGISFNRVRFTITEFPETKLNSLYQFINTQGFNHEIYFGNVGDTDNEIYLITDNKTAAELFYGDKYDSYKDATRLPGFWVVSNDEFTAIIPVGTVVKPDVFQEKIMNKIDSRNGLLPMSMGMVFPEDKMLNQVVASID